MLHLNKLEQSNRLVKITSSKASLTNFSPKEQQTHFKACVFSNASSTNTIWISLQKIQRVFLDPGKSYKGWKKNLKSWEKNISTWFFSSLEPKLPVCFEVLACWECVEVAVTFSEQASIIESSNFISFLPRQNLEDWKINKNQLIKLTMSTEKTFRHCIWYMYESWAAKCTCSCRICKKAGVLKLI